MKDCCIRGVKHDGEPGGELKQIGGIKSYVATPKSPNGLGIVYFPDAFGLELSNNRLYVSA